jgi:hypothetical protein
MKMMKMMDEVWHKAGKDCHQSPGPKPENACEKDLHMLDQDFHKMWRTAKHRNAKAMEAELEFMVKDTTEIQTVCHLEGECMKDS